MEQIDGIASITDDGLGVWIPMSECPKEGDSQDVQRRKDRKARKVLRLENPIADLDEMCSNVLM